MFDRNEAVYIGRCTEYDAEKLTVFLTDAIAALGKDGWFKDEAVVIKPNLVRKMDPELGGTTHPAVLEAAVRAVKSFGARSVLVAESPGGVYSEAHLRQNYDGCGMTAAAKKAGAELNFGLGSRELKAPDGKICRAFDVIDPILDAGVVLNLSKMKSHGMLVQSCAAKNLFGVIPGVKKFEMHARFPHTGDFASMLCDLTDALHRDRKILSVCDGIVGMEGNGPTNGSPKRGNVMLVSANPFCIDLACSKIMNMPEPPEMLAEGIARGFCPGTVKELNVLGEDPAAFVLTDFVLPDSSKPSALKKFLTLSDGKYAALFEPRPVVNGKTCRGCGECVRSCPQKTVSMKKRRGKLVARIGRKNCIKCYCCQELCPFDSVKIHRNILLKIFGKS